MAEYEDKASAKGFAGLSSLVSSIEAGTAVEHVELEVASAPSGTTKHHGESAEQQSSEAAPFVSDRPDGPRTEEASDRDRPTEAASQDNGGLSAVAVLAIVGVLLLAVVSIASRLGGSDSTSSQVVPAVTGQTEPIPAVVQPPVAPTHAVAAVKANLRASSSAKSPSNGTLSRGAPLFFLGEADTFIHVQRDDGTSGYIAQNLVIPWVELARLQGTSAREYINGEDRGQRIESVLAHIQSPASALALDALTNGLVTRTTQIDELLQAIPEIKPLNITTDSAAATWFGLESQAAMHEGRITDARESAMAAFKADPTNGDYLVAIVLADNTLGEDDGVVKLGYLLPLFSPRSTNAWMLFALSRSMVDVPNESLVRGAFVLAVRLSRSPGATRNYFKRLAESARKPHVRELIYLALAEEQENPMLFSNATRPDAALPNRARQEAQTPSTGSAGDSQ